MKKPKIPTDKLKPQRQFALNLLKQGKTDAEIQSEIKEKFGESLSPRDLQLVRSSIIDLPTDINVYIQAFKDCFTTLTNSPVKRSHSIVRKAIKKYADLMISLEKQEMLDSTPIPYRDSEPILIALDTLEKSKEGWLS